jgi:glycosyltransferase involved in cell wall biosynthesis
VSVSVILLAHNEADTIEQEIREFHRSIVSVIPGAEFIVAEDGSSDGTRERILATANDIPLRVTGAAERLGYARAVGGAVRDATQPWILLCDGGMKHDPNDFWRLWEARDRFDYIAGRKTNREDQWYRRLFTWGFNLVIRQLFDYEIFDADSGMRLMNRRVADEVIPRTTFRNFSSSEIVIRTIHSGLRYREVPISYRQRAGESRGLPTARLPKAISGAVRDLLRLRRELRGTN